MPVTARVVGPELIRLASFAGIVTLHTNSHGGFAGLPWPGYILDELSRFAVPTFFVVSGYFWRQNLVGKPIELVSRVAGRVAAPFAFWFVIYTALGIVGYMGSEYQGRSVVGLLTGLWSGGAGYHLWFLPALVVGAAIIGLSGMLGWRNLVALVVALYGAGVLMGTYSPTLMGVTFPTSLYRNGVFFAPLFLLIGVWLRTEPPLVRIANIWLVALLAASTAIHLLEGFFFAGRFPEGHDYSLGTVGMALAIAVLGLRLQGTNAWISTLGAASFGAFLLHAAVLQLFLNIGLVSVPWIVIPLTICLSLAIALVFKRAAGASPVAAVLGY